MTALAARAAREHARLAYAHGEPLSVLAPVQAQHPDNWGEVGGEPYSLIPRQEPGAVVGSVGVQSSGRYQVWLQGAFSRNVEVWIDGRRVGSASDELGPPGQFTPIAAVDLRAGPQQISIVVPNDSLAPGASAVNQTVGPLVLVPSSSAEPVAEVSPANARSLCGRALDWIEIVR